MSEAVLFVGHGTRDLEGVAESATLMAMQRERMERLVPVVETAYLELNSPTIPEGIGRCIGRGATSILLVPLLLFSAGHHKHDIPAIVRHAQSELQASDCSVTIAPPLGMNHLLLDVVLDRILEAKPGGDGKSAVVLVSRGNRDEMAANEFERVAARVKDKSAFYKGIESCTAAVMTGKGRTLEDALDEAVGQNATSILVVPYLLFRGRVSQEMKARLNRWGERKVGVELALAGCLWPDERIVDAFHSVALASLAAGISTDSD